MVSLRQSGSEFATLLGPSGELGLAQQPLACHALSLRRGSEFAKSPLPRTPHSPDCHCGSPLAFQSFLTKPLARDSSFLRRISPPGDKTLQRARGDRGGEILRRNEESLASGFVRKL